MKTVYRDKKSPEGKMGEMQKVSEIFKSNLNYYQRVAHKKLSKKNVLLDFQVSLFLAVGPF
jgi:hypothetical protein